jgi:hypothetical protein
MKKKTKNILLIGIAVILIGLGIYFFRFHNPFSFFNNVGTGPGGGQGTATQIASTSTYYTYTMTASASTNPYSTSNVHFLQSQEQSPINFSGGAGFSNVVSSGGLTLPSDMQTWTTFPATVTITGATAGYFPPGYGYATTEVPMTVTNLTATCTPYRAMNSNQANSIQCTVNGIANNTEPTLTGGFQLFNAQVTWTANFPKIGIQCLDNSYCSLGQICQNNQCVSAPIIYYEFSNNTCTPVSKLSSQALPNDYSTSALCYANVVNAPTPPKSSGFWGFLQNINSWISNLFNKLFGLSITGATNVEPNTQQSYLINMSVSNPNSDYTTGNISYDYGYWGIVDANNNTLQTGNITGTNGNFIANVTINTPLNPGNYMLIGMVTQINGVYNYQIHSWFFSPEQIINKEAISLSNKYIIVPPTQPVSGGFSQLIQSIINFFKTLFGIK